ncbi:protein of unknown function [Cupriavidus taiwanensis]|uniref:Uncharacterized protein n=1 Tax=Cupriavidus taiwanensis TaxID=164546 RepID=A0A9Q7UQU0_9BURK|nr:protein of unknown function [Cupriavidus taiwanensis]
MQTSPVGGQFPPAMCGSLNQMLRRVEPLGERVMIQGLTVAKGAVRQLPARWRRIYGFGQCQRKRQR